MAHTPYSKATKPVADYVKKRAIARTEFDKQMGGYSLVSLGTTALQSRLSWLDHVADYEYSETDTARILAAMRECYAAIAPMVSHYIDGEA